MGIVRSIHLHIPPPSNHNSLPTHIRKQRTGNPQNRPRRFLRTTRPPQRNIRIHFLCIIIIIIIPGSPLELLPGNPQRNLRPIRRGDECPILLRSRETGSDVPERDGVGTDTEPGTPFFGDGFCEAYQACFGEGVVRLASVFNFLLVLISILILISTWICMEMVSGLDICCKRGQDIRIPMNPRCTTNINNNPGLIIPNSEVRRSSTDQFKGGRVMDCEHRVPLLVCHLFFFRLDLC